MTPLRAGNLRVRRWLPGPRGGAQPELVREWSYDPVTNFVAQYTDPDLGTIQYAYDAAGNLLQITEQEPGLVWDFTYDVAGRLLSQTWPDDGTGHRRRDEWTYYAAGPSLGYLATSVRDAGVGQLALTRAYTWTPPGWLSGETDERGNTWNYTRNALDQVVRAIGPAIASQGGVRYETDYAYDANDNVVAIDVQNRDETGALDAGNPYLTHLFNYDTGTFELLTSVIREIDASTTGTTEFQYDANENVVLVRLDGAVSGAHPTQVVGVLYDERRPGVPDPARAGWTGPVEPAARLRRQRQRRDARDRARRRRADDDVRLRRLRPPRDADRRARERAHVRLGRALEPRRDRAPGRAGRRHRRRRERAARDDDVRLRRGLAAHARRARLVRPADAAADRLRDVGVDLDLVGPRRSASVLDPNGASTVYEYDDALRLELVTDAAGNQIQYGYDGADNVIARCETHASLIVAPAVYDWTFTYDELDRLETRAGPAGPPLSFEYDSRSNLRLEIDERGNVTRYAYDGLDRVVVHERDLTDTGTGGGSVLSTEVTQYGYDYAFGLTSVIDDDTYATVYAHDDLGRRVSTLFADTTQHVRTYDAHDDVVLLSDANGTLITSAYDALGRLAAQTVVPGPGVANTTTLQGFSYDGLDRLVAANDDDTAVARSWDSLSNLVSDAVTIQRGGGPLVLTTSYAYDERGQRHVADLSGRPSDPLRLRRPRAADRGPRGPVDRLCERLGRTARAARADDLSGRWRGRLHVRRPAAPAARARRVRPDDDRRPPGDVDRDRRAREPARRAGRRLGLRLHAGLARPADELGRDRRERDDVPDGLHAGRRQRPLAGHRWPGCGPVRPEPRAMPRCTSTARRRSRARRPAT